MISKAKQLQIAMALQQISMSEEIADRIITTYEKLRQVGDQFNLRDAVAIEIEVTEKYAKKKLKDNQE